MESAPAIADITTSREFARSALLEHHTVVFFTAAYLFAMEDSSGLMEHALAQPELLL
jgi:hypothetical protein